MAQPYPIGIGSHPKRLRRGLDGTEQPVRAARVVGPLSVLTLKVYDRCMTRTNVDIDDQACAEVMRRYRLATKGEAINLALRMLAAETALSMKPALFEVSDGRATSTQCAPTAPRDTGLHLGVDRVPGRHGNDGFSTFFPRLRALCGESSYPLSRRGREPAPYSIRGLG